MRIMLMWEQILSVVGSCRYNLVAYEAHTLKKQNGEPRVQTKIIFNFLCTFLVHTHSGLDCVKKTQRSMSHAWAPLR